MLCCCCFFVFMFSPLLFFYSYCDLCFCRFFSIAVCTLLFFFVFTFQTLLQFAILDATRFNCCCSDFLLLLLLLLTPLVFCHCVMHAARQQLLCIIILHILFGAFLFVFYEFSVFFTDQQNETLRRDASWTNRTPPLKFYKWLSFALSFSYKNKHAKPAARTALACVRECGLSLALSESTSPAVLLVNIVLTRCTIEWVCSAQSLLAKQIAYFWGCTQLLTHCRALTVAVNSPTVAVR